MRLLIIGGSGFIGSYLTSFFRKSGFKVTVVALSGKKPPFLNEDIEYVQGDTTKAGSWMEEVPKNDVVINLAGFSIARRWNSQVKQAILNSRVETTRNVVTAILKGRPSLLINASAVGYYGDCGEKLITEDNPGGEDFLAQVCKAWEKEAFRARDKAKVIVTRFGVVLGKHGGALSKMLTPFKLGFGGALGSGKQWFSWVHIHDLARAIAFLIDNTYLSGPFNLCSPCPVRNADFSRALAEVIHRPAFFKVPSFILKLVFGEMSYSMLASYKCIPARLLRAGFSFQFPSIETALKDITESKEVFSCRKIY